MKSNAKESLLYQIKENKLYNTKMVLTVDHLFDLNSSKISRTKIKSLITEMDKEGKLLVKDDKIVPHDKFIIGVYETKRFGGVVVADVDGKKKTFPVATSKFENLPHKTLVGFIVEEAKDKTLAHIASIISFNENSLYGNVKLNKRQELTFVPDFNPFNAKFALEDNHLAREAVGRKCKVKINLHNTHKNKFEVVIENEKDIFGSTYSPLANIEAVLKEEEISRDFNEKVLKEAKAIPSSVTEKEIIGKKDYRHLPFITIDPEEAKDMDDAVYFEKQTNNKGETIYKYMIAIADVSHYVPEGSEIDKEALSRAFSIYPAGGVVPMLPTKISGNICSLMENEDRLAIVAEITLDNLGNTIDYSFFEGVIKNKSKLSYETVEQIYNNEIVLDTSQNQLKTMINDMYEITDKLIVLDEKNGTISLSGEQPTIILNESKDDVLDYVNKNRITSTRVIEKAMILVNSSVAEFLKNLNVPILSRMHETPIAERFAEFINYLSFAGIDTEKFVPTNKNYIDISKLIEDHYLESILTRKLVRSMQKAKYTSDPEAYHFALAKDDYSHFTAGIRRYVDIVTHRKLKTVLEYYNEAVKKELLDGNLPMNKNTEKFYGLYKEQLTKLDNTIELEEIAKHVNEKELDYMKIEERTNDICAAILLRKHFGKTFSAYISSVEKDHVVATLKDDNDPQHSDIIDVIVSLKDLIKNKNVYVDTKNWSVNEVKTSKVVYYEGKKLNIVISDVNLAEGKIFGKDDYVKKFETVKNNSKTTQGYKEEHSQSI